MGRSSASALSKEAKQLYRELIDSGQATMYKDIINPVTIDGDTAIIHCLKWGTLQKVYVDTDDLNKIALGYSILIVERNKNNNDITVRIKNEAIHRIIMKPPDNMVVHHKNHNTLDNRKANLEIITQEENLVYKKLFKTSSTGRKNITLRNGYYAINITRTFINRDYAEEALDKVQGIIQHYSLLDAKEKAQARTDSYNN